METNSETEKSTKEVLNDYFKEIIGYENGLWRTIVDLRKHPDIVLKGYLTKDQKYVGPFRILISALSLWVLVNSFFLDWHSAFKGLMYRMANWVQSFVSIPEQNKAKFDRYLLESASLYARLAGDLFAKYYVPFVLIGLPLTAFLASKKCKKYGIDFKTILAAVSYTISLNIVLMFVVSVCAYFDIFVTFIILGIPLIALQLIGKGELISFLALRKFFSSNGIEIEKIVTKSMITSTFIILLPGMTYFFYYTFFVIVER